MQHRPAYLRICPRRCPVARPRIVRGLVDKVLQLVQRLRGNTGDVILGSLAVAPKLTRM